MACIGTAESMGGYMPIGKDVKDDNRIRQRRMFKWDLFYIFVYAANDCRVDRILLSFTRTLKGNALGLLITELSTFATVNFLRQTVRGRR